MLNILKLNLIKNISFWNYEKARECPVALLNSSIVLNKACVQQTYSRVQIVGLLFHFLYERFLLGQIKIHDYKTFLLELDKFKSNFMNKFNFEILKPLDQWSEVENIFEFLANHEEIEFVDSKQTASFERRLFSNDGLILGSPDIVIFREGNYLVIENKSGSLYHDGSLKSEYVRQLHFYAILIKENYNIYPSHLILRSLKEGEVEVIFDEGLSMSLKKDALALIELVNNEINNSTDFNEIVKKLAKPSEQACFFCNLRVHCSKYISSVDGLLGKANRFCIQGSYSDTVSVKDKAYCSISLLTSFGECRVLNVPTSKLDSIKSSCSMAFYDLIKKDRNTYEYNKNSSVLIYE